MADKEININIRNTIDVTNANNPNTNAPGTQVEAETGKNPNDVGINFQQAVGVGMKFANAIGIGDIQGFDFGIIQKVSHYGFSVSKAIAGVAKGSYGGLISLAVELASEAIMSVRNIEKEIAAQQNAVDQARIRTGTMDIDGCSAKVNFWNGRITYGKYRG